MTSYEDVYSINQICIISIFALRYFTKRHMRDNNRMTMATDNERYTG